ncbi:MAG: CBS domain-containing protein [Parcubacteria group bacterium]
MTKKVITATAEMHIKKAADLLMKYRIHGLPVINKNREILGIVTEVDFFSKNGDNLYLPQYISLLQKVNVSQFDSRKQKTYLKKIQEAKIADIMTINCICLNQDSSINEAIEIFKKNNFNILPIINNQKKLVGIVSLSDLFKLIKK